MNDFLIFSFGFIAPVLFFARTFIQWYSSEKENKIISPGIYWKLSIAGSIILLVYGILRNDFAIILGQFIVYPIYIRNLQLKDVWGDLNLAWKLTVVLLPILCLAWIIGADSYNIQSILNNEEVSVFLLIYGSAGQVIFTFRFIYQWIYSENKKESVLPLGFWFISILGSLIILSYAVMRYDPVFFLAHIFSLFIYIRNIFLYYGKKSIFQMVTKKTNASYKKSSS